MPPPRTRSNSEIPVMKRSSSDAVIKDSDFASAFTAAEPDFIGDDGCATRTSSIIVFHSPHPAHLPTHFGLS